MNRFSFTDTRPGVRLLPQPPPLSVWQQAYRKLGANCYKVGWVVDRRPHKFCQAGVGLRGGLAALAMREGRVGSETIKRSSRRHRHSRAPVEPPFSVRNSHIVSLCFPDSHRPACFSPLPEVGSRMALTAVRVVLSACALPTNRQILILLPKWPGAIYH
jgi:hypothetical protein